MNPMTDELVTPEILNQVPLDGMGQMLVRNRDFGAGAEATEEYELAVPPAPLAEPLPSRAPSRSQRLSSDTLTAMSGARRSAVLLLALGVDTAVKVIPLLKDDEVEAVSVEIARMKNVPGEQVEAVLAEYRDLALAREYVTQGGPVLARQMLSSALGDDRAEEVLMKVEAAMEVSAFHLLHTVEPGRLVDLLQGEHPQTAALILSQLNPRKAGEIVGKLSPDVQGEIIFRVATMSPPAPEVLREVEDVIRQQIGAVLGAETSSGGGMGKVAEILVCAGRAAERTVMDALRERAPELAAAVKGMMFVFDDLVHLDGRDLQKLLAGVDSRDLALALKAAPEELADKVFKNVSERAAQGLREEAEMLGAVRVSEVDEAQARILEVAQDLEGRGEITLVRGGAPGSATLI